MVGGFNEADTCEERQNCGREGIGGDSVSFLTVVFERNGQKRLSPRSIPFWGNRLWTAAKPVIPFCFPVLAPLLALELFELRGVDVPLFPFFSLSG